MICTRLRCLASLCGGDIGCSGSWGFAASSSNCCYKKKTYTHKRWLNHIQKGLNFQQGLWLSISWCNAGDCPWVPNHITSFYTLSQKKEAVLPIHSKSNAVCQKYQDALLALVYFGVCKLLIHQLFFANSYWQSIVQQQICQECSILKSSNIGRLTSR